MDSINVEQSSQPSDSVSISEDLDEMDILKYSDSEEGDDAGVVGSISSVVKDGLDVIDEGIIFRLRVKLYL